VATWAGPAEVPDVVRRTSTVAAQLLGEAGYGSVEQKAEILSTALVGKVTTQDPPAHARADSGTAVTITIGVLAPVDVPPVVGLSASAVKDSLEANHLWGRFTGPSSDSAVVKSQLPLAHTRVDAWSRVDLAMVVPPKPATPPPRPPEPQPTATQSTPPPPPWPWKVLLALAGTVVAAGIAREIKSWRRVRAIQVVPVRDAGTQALTVTHDTPDTEVRRLGLELRLIVDPGMQRVRPESLSVRKERTGV